MLPLDVPISLDRTRKLCHVLYLIIWQLPFDVVQSIRSRQYSNNVYFLCEQDYPSVSQIATKIREKSVNLIFAVTEEQLEIYDKLSNYIEGSEATRLANDSSNIVMVIRENYQVQQIEYSITFRKSRKKLVFFTLYIWFRFVNYTN